MLIHCFFFNEGQPFGAVADIHDEVVDAVVIAFVFKRGEIGVKHVCGIFPDHCIQCFFLLPGFVDHETKPFTIVAYLVFNAIQMRILVSRVKRRPGFVGKIPEPAMEVDLRRHQQNQVKLFQLCEKVNFIDISWWVVVLIGIAFVVVIPVFLFFEQPAAVILHDVQIIAVGDNQDGKVLFFRYRRKNHLRVSAFGGGQRANEVEQFPDIVVSSPGDPGGADAVDCEFWQGFPGFGLDPSDQCIHGKGHAIKAPVHPVAWEERVA